MGAKQSSTQTGAQDQGLVVTGKSGAINTGTTYNSTTQPNQAITGSANTVSYTTNGVSADSLKDIFGAVSKPSDSQVSAATPVSLTPTSVQTGGAVTTDAQKNYVKYGLIAVAVLVIGLIVRKFFKK